MTLAARRFQPTIETLESRTLLAASASLTGNILKVVGSDAADSITLRQINGRLLVDGTNISTSAGSIASVALTQVAKIEVYGNNGNDVIHLDSEKVAGQQPITLPTLINAGAGDDQVYGSAGKDTIYAGAGNDVVFAGAGNDTVFADGGADQLDGGDGDDYLAGGDGNNKLYGQAGNDTLLGNAGADYLDGGGGIDLLNAGSGFDTSRDAFDPARPVIDSAQPSDVVQQQSVTCQTLAALAAHATTGANIAGQIVYRGGNQYDVKLFKNGAWVFERVIFDGVWTDTDAAPSRNAEGRTVPEFWVLLFQRARMQQFGLDWRGELSRSQWDAANVRSGYRLYDPNDALLSFTGRTPRSVNVSQGTPQALRDALAQKKAVLATTLASGAVDPASGILGWHTYTITRVYQEGATWKLQVYNPWGIDGLGTPRDGKADGFVTVTWAEFTRNFSRYSIA